VPAELVVHGRDHDVVLHTDRVGGVAAELRQVVGGVTISRREPGLNQWLCALAETVVGRPARTAALRRALERFLGRGDVPPVTPGRRGRAGAVRRAGAR
jgi:hypothetical protein